MDSLPPLVEGGKICYCEVAGGLIYTDDSKKHVHPSIENLPIPQIKELQRRAKP